MKKLARLVTHHWQAKLLTLLLALMLWAVARKSIEATGSPSRFRFERESAADKFEFSKKP
jgi:hypothetical protein